MQSAKNLYSEDLDSKQNTSNILNAQTMEKDFQIFQQIIRQAKKDDHVAVLWGFSGAGKSTSALILGGEKVKSYHLGVQGAIITAANPKSGVRDIRINHTYKSGTIYPSPIIIKTTNPDDQKIIIWDMPGLGENRSKYQVVINSYFIHHLFKFYNKVKLIFALDINIISSRNKSQKNQHGIKQLTDVLGLFQKYQQSVAVMFTKVTVGVKQTQIKTSIGKMLSQVGYLDDHAQFKTFLKQIVSGKVPITVMNMPNISQQPLISQQEAVDVTNQYTSFIKDTYENVKALKPHKFTQINNILSEEEKKRCRNFIVQTSNRLDIQIDQIIKLILKKLNEKFSKINLKENNEEKLKKNIQQFKNIGVNISQIQKYTALEDSMLNRNDILKQKMELLHKSLIKIGCGDNSGEIQSLKQFTNQFILVSFFSTLKLYENEKDPKIIKSQNDAKVRLLQQIKKKKFSKIYQEKELELYNNIKTHIKSIYLEDFLKNLSSSSVYLKWENQYKTIPAIFKSLTCHNQNQNPEMYFKHSIKLSKILKFSSAQSLQQIISVLKNNNLILSSKLDQNFIKQQIIPIVIEKWGTLIKLIKNEEYFNEAITKNTIQGFQLKFNSQIYQEKQAADSKDKINQLNKIIHQKQEKIKSKEDTICSLQSDLDFLKKNKEENKSQSTKQINTLRQQNNTLKLEKIAIQNKCKRVQRDFNSLTEQSKTLKIQLQKEKGSKKPFPVKNSKINQPGDVYLYSDKSTNELNQQSVLKETKKKLQQSQQALQLLKDQNQRLKNENIKLKAAGEPKVQKKRSCCICWF